MNRPIVHKAVDWLERLMEHWLLAVVMIFVAAALTISQIDTYPLSFDAIFSYTSSSGFFISPYTLVDLLGMIEPNQGPMHYVLLHLWGKVAGHSLSAARLISLFCGLLSLAMVYRLTRDFVSPIAGTFAAFVLLCSAFYAFYYAHVRYYTLVVWLAALIVWLYLRIATRRQQPKRRDYLALLLACYALISTHAFGFLVYLTLALYHLLAVRKDRRWPAVVATALIALLLAAPWLSVMLTAGLEQAQQTHAKNASSISSILTTWLTIISNGNPLLLGVSLVGVMVGWRRKWLRGNPFLPLFPLLVVSIGLASAATGIVSIGQMRYLLVGMPIVVAFTAAGLFALYRLRRWLGLLAALLWLVAGLAFMRAADWEQLIQGRTWAYTHPPWHLLSRWMMGTGEEFPVVTVGLSHRILAQETFLPRHLMAFYFEQHGIPVHKHIVADLDGRIGDNALEQPGYWIVSQHGISDLNDIRIVAAMLEKYGYEHCGEKAFPNHTALHSYRWKSLHCDPQPKATFATDAGDYMHYGAHYEGGKLLFTSAWQPAITADPDTHNISFQLLDADWRNHGQIDLPTSSLSEMRQLIFELSDLPAGDYRLMVVVYDAQTGERQVWQANEDWIPEMQQLAEMIVSVRDDNTP